MTGMKVGMMVCCAIMMIPLVGYFVAGGSFALSGGAVGAALPLVVCLAAHGLMFAVMGKSCHGDKKTATVTSPALKPTTIPQVGRTTSATSDLSVV